MATSKTRHDSARQIKDAVSSEPFVYGDDEVDHAKFMDDGRAHAIVHFGSCMCATQVQLLRDSDMWELEAVHPHHHGDDGVTAHVVEVLDTEDDQ